MVVGRSDGKRQIQKETADFLRQTEVAEEHTNSIISKEKAKSVKTMSKKT